MSQIFRQRRTDVCLLSRYYGNYRKLNHYEILRIPSNSTQKDIRQAFIKLSKELHPDTSGKGSHEEFVKLNEAYNILSKKTSRYQYDMDLKYNSRTFYDDGMYNYRQYRNAYASQRDWDNYMSRRYDFPERDYSNVQSSSKRFSNITFAFMCFIISAVGVTLQFLAVQRSLTFKRKNILKQSQIYEDEYKKIQNDNEKNTPELVNAFQERMRQHTEQLRSTYR